MIHATRVTLNAKSNISGGDQDEEITQGSGMRNFVGLDEMPPTLRGRFSTDGKRTQKGAKKASPFLYIYSLQRALFLDGFRDGRGDSKSRFS